MEHLHQIVGKFVFGWFKHTFFVEKKKICSGKSILYYWKGCLFPFK